MSAALECPSAAETSISTNPSENGLPAIAILPLSPNTEITGIEDPGIQVYYEFLQEAFSNPGIRNFALTGSYGVGKSSIIKSFDKVYQGKRADTSFLYVSIGEYRKTTPQPADEQNAVEKRMLLQIFSRFHNCDFPQSSLWGIPESPKRWKSIALPLFATLATVSGILLVCKSTITEILRKLISGTPVWTFLSKYAEASLCVFALLGILFGMFYGFKWLYRKKKSSQLTIKASKFEWKVDDKSHEDYLDRFTQELVYCLTCISEEISNTVVFEDLDRLDTEVCISIFTRLRELNHILNTHMEGGAYIRFVYVINDALANTLVCDKFFDYVLSVIPTLNERSSRIIFRRYLQCIHNYLTLDKPDLKQCLNTFMEGNEELLDKIADSLTGYRMMYSVLNAYSVMVRLYGSKNSITCDALKKILVFQVYKYLWPADYHCAVTKQNSILTGKSPWKVGRRNSALLKYFLDQGLLNMNSLYYAGYCKKEILTQIEDSLKTGNVDRQCRIISQMDPTDPDHLEIVKEHCSVPTGSTTDRADKRTLAAAIAFTEKAEALHEANSVNRDWLLANRTSTKVLESLVVVRERDKAVFCNFVGKSQKYTKIGIFNDNTRQPLVRNNEWTFDMALCFSEVAPEIETCVVLADGTSAKLPNLLHI